jgi:hypothetical protein
MQLFQPFLFSLSLVVLALLGACGSGTQTTNSTPANTANKNIETPTAKTSSSPSVAKSATQNNTSQKGGQVIESGVYHLEFLSVIEADSIHLDFFLQKGDSHEAIPDAKVTAQIQLPDGTQQNLDMKYDADGKHYAVLLPSKAAGEYKLAILSDIKGEKVNGRFNFKK